MVVVVDYGMGNLRSVEKALAKLGASVTVSQQPADVRAAEQLILPGVGAFPAAMQELGRRGLIEPVQQVIARGVPFLGICLGLQLLFETSDEGVPTKGLGVLPGRVRRFDAPDIKVPHMGWNQVRRQGAAAQGGCPLLEGIADDSFVYFVHSYYGEPADRSVVALETDYGVRFPAMVWRGRVFATQFHPEKSQAVGLRLLENFLRLH